MLCSATRADFLDRIHAILHHSLTHVPLWQSWPWDWMNSLDILEEILEFIYSVIGHHSKLRKPFWAESFLADPQLLSQLIELGDSMVIYQTM